MQNDRVLCRMCMVFWVEGPVRRVFNQRIRSQMPIGETKLFPSASIAMIVSRDQGHGSGQRGDNAREY